MIDIGLLEDRVRYLENYVQDVFCGVPLELEHKIKHARVLVVGALNQDDKDGDLGFMRNKTIDSTRWSHIDPNYVGISQNDPQWDELYRCVRQKILDTGVRDNLRTLNLYVLSVVREGLSLGSTPAHVSLDYIFHTIRNREPFSSVYFDHVTFPHVPHKSLGFLRNLLSGDGTLWVPWADAERYTDQIEASGFRRIREDYVRMPQSLHYIVNNYSEEVVDGYVNHHYVVYVKSP